MSTVWLRVSRGDCLTPAPPGQQGPPKLLVRARYSAQEAPAVSAHMIWAAAPGLPAESKVRGGGGISRLGLALCFRVTGYYDAAAAKPERDSAAGCSSDGEAKQGHASIRM